VTANDEDETLAALARATASLPAHEERPEQRDMALAVARAIRGERHLIVEAGTGTGKSLAYLVPALTLGAKVVVSTATKALQDQLAQRDLPRLESSLGKKFRFAVLKGRSNYVCRQRVEELAGAGQQLALDAPGRASQSPLAKEVWELVEWAKRQDGPAGSDQWASDRSDKRALLGGSKGSPRGSPSQGGRGSGDRAELSFEPSDLAWSQVSTGWRECPGAAECPSGGECFVELARKKAADADVVVVNTHLYATSLALEEAVILPPHDLVVFDEAHELEDIVSAAFGFEVGGARLGGLVRLARPVGVAPATITGLEDAASSLAAVLRAHRDKALSRPLDQDLAGVVVLLRERVGALAEELRRLQRSAPGGVPSAAGESGGTFGSARAGEAGGAGGTKREAKKREAMKREAIKREAKKPSGPLPAPSREEAGAARQRAQKAASHLLDDINSLLELPEGQLAWVEGPENAPVVRVAPIDVGAALYAKLWSKEGAPTAILTSATIPQHLGQRLGLAESTFEELDVGSPFEYSEQALLYCPLHLPDPRAAGFESAMHEELVALIEAAEGRALALFTSWRAMRAALDVVRERVKWKVLAQGELPKPKLVAEFGSDEHSCLFATMGFWQGLDVPGPALSLVTIDRLPFPRPDDPLLSARRSALGPAAFQLIDLPRAATLLAQGAGRLVRSRLDRGVVAVLDRRLGKAPYRWELVKALPPMRRTRSREEVIEFLARIRGPHPG
jgi:ATP-dependent DNA helicase DinG